MSNMSASILRNIVGSVFPVSTKNVILSGEISPEFIPQNECGHSWWNGASEQYDCVWGFNPKTGFKRITETEEDLETIASPSEWMINRAYHYSHNGDSEFEAGEMLLDHPEANEFVFFLVNSRGRNYGEQGETFDTWTLYKAPDFKKKWAEIEEEDVKRWNDWI